MYLDHVNYQFSIKNYIRMFNLIIYLYDFMSLR
jgi:hypothetical protein